MNPTLRILEKPEEMQAVVLLQNEIWGPGEEVPDHMLISVIRNGGLLVGAFIEGQLVGFVFGFPALTPSTGNVQELKHCSHMMAIHPKFQNHGIGYLLKRAQWQMVRGQGIQRITWTYDPLLSRNAHLNIEKLGAVCNTYYEDYYGEMGDKLNAGLPSDRFEVDLWINTPRVSDRMSRQPRRSLDLGHYFAGGAHIINPTHLIQDDLPEPPADAAVFDTGEQSALYLLEIPSDFQSLRNKNPNLAYRWRMHSRSLFKILFQAGYLVTDFVFLRGENPRSFYVLSDGGRSLGD